MVCCDILVIGGGAAGLAAALAASERGGSVLLTDAEGTLGGVLRQCLHRGFGEGLTGPAYARRLVERVERSGVRVRTGVSVLELGPDRTALLSSRTGLERAAFRRCVLAAGCRERTVHSLPMAGTRPKGVYTAGQAQRLTNLGHYDIGDDIVILGSGDVGQIMARQLVQAGKRVTAVIEQRSALGGLARNRRACIEAYRIPVLLRSTVDEILGEDRIQGVMVRNLETGMRDRLACGALVTALGLIPDRTLAGSGGAPEWLRLCGNCDYVHDMVDRVVREAASLGAELGEESAREGYI